MTSSQIQICLVKFLVLFLENDQYFNFGFRKSHKTHEIQSPHEEVLGARGVSDMH